MLQIDCIDILCYNVICGNIAMMRHITKRKGWDYMFEIIFFGTCSGTEPQKDMHHCAWAIKKDDVYYWFDAGEGCSRTALLMGEDVTSIKTVFISHPHIDHTGGLANLIFTMRKLLSRRGEKRDMALELFVPKMKVWDCARGLLEFEGTALNASADVNAHLTEEGVIFADENISVEAFSNRHMQKLFGDEKISYSFKIKIDGKIIVFSGDVKDLDDVDRVVSDGCDYLIMETGHHNMDDVIEYVENHNVETLLFNHHGRYIIENRDEAKKKAAACKKKAIICEDKLKISL